MSGEKERELIRLGLLKPGPDQVVKVNTVTERDRARSTTGTPRHKTHKVHTQADRVDSAPVRCQIWDRNRMVGVVPVTFDDMGHPSDVVFQPSETEKATRLAFLWSGRVFGFHFGETIHFSPSKPLHLALAHLSLRDKFGTLVLEAGKG